MGRVVVVVASCAIVIALACSPYDEDDASRESPGWISPDGCRMYIVSDRGPPYFEIFLATRAPTP